MAVGAEVYASARLEFGGNDLDAHSFVERCKPIVSLEHFSVTRDSVSALEMEIECVSIEFRFSTPTSLVGQVSSRTVCDS